MPWENPLPHRCTKPMPLFAVLEGRRVGDVWACPECQKRWELAKHPQGGLHWIALGTGRLPSGVDIARGL